MLFLLVPLAGCLDASRQEQGALRAVPVMKGAVVISGPRGYCVDPSGLERGREGAFARLASCNRLTGEAGPRVLPSVMTVSVLAAGAAEEAPDSAALSRALAPIPVRSPSDEAGLALVQVMSGGQEMLPGGDPVHWRGGMMLNGHLLGLAVYGAQGGPLSGPEGADLLRALAAALRASSPTRGAAGDDG